MSSETDIANQALAYLGEAKVSSINDTSSKQARACATSYAQARDEVLRSARWSCAKKMQSLSKLVTAPVYKWTAAYQLPSDFIRLCEIEGEYAWVPREWFDIQGRQLMLGLNDEEAPDDIGIEYISRVTDTTLFDPLLVEAVALKLAAKVARELTGSDNKAAQLLEEYERVVLPKALTIDAQQRHSGENHPIMKILSRSWLARSRYSDSEF